MLKASTLSLNDTLRNRVKIETGRGSDQLSLQSLEYGTNNSRSAFRQTCRWYGMNYTGPKHVRRQAESLSYCDRMSQVSMPSSYDTSYNYVKIETGRDSDLLSLQILAYGTNNSRSAFRQTCCWYGMNYTEPKYAHPQAGSLFCCGRMLQVSMLLRYDTSNNHVKIATVCGWGQPSLQNSVDDTNSSRLVSL